MNTLNTDSFSYHLPTELIAQSTLPKRDDARLMVLRREDHSIHHKRFKDLPELLDSEDLLVLNNTRVIPARFYGWDDNGRDLELLFLRENPPGSEDSNKNLRIWECLVKRSKILNEESTIHLPLGIHGNVVKKLKSGGVWIAMPAFLKPMLFLKEYGHTPLPPYIKRMPDDTRSDRDRRRYQSVFARHDGSLAAPTAGLHFTKALINRLKKIGVEIKFITLHLGTASFLPVRTSNPHNHELRPEYFSIPEDTLSQLHASRERGGRLVAVGTSTVRALEGVNHLENKQGTVKGYTDLFILPGFEFKYTQSMITNFHLPRSTNLMMVSAFARRDFILKAYGAAVDKGYRFFSYGDAMIIL